MRNLNFLNEHDGTTFLNNYIWHCKINLIIFFLELANIKAPYLGNFMNFKAYYVTHIPFLKVNEFKYLCLLLLKGKELIMEINFKLLLIKITHINTFLSFHWSNKTWNTPLSWQAFNSTLSTDPTPMFIKTLYTSSMNSWGYSSTLEPWNSTGSVLLKSLTLVSTIPTFSFMGTTITLLVWVNKSWDNTCKVARNSTLFTCSKKG